MRSSIFTAGLDSIGWASQAGLLKSQGVDMRLEFLQALQLHDARLLEQNWQFLMALRASLACTPPALAQQVSHYLDGISEAACAWQLF